MSDYFPFNLPLESAAVKNIEVGSTQIDANDVSGKIALTIAEAAYDRKAGDILVLRVADVSYLGDYFVIMTGFSKVQVRAIADSIFDKVAQQWQRKPLRTEGKSEGSWILQDYGEVIVHIMTGDEREFYNLEAFWGHAERIEWTISSESGGKS